MKKSRGHLDRHTDKVTYSYKLSVAPEHGKRTINVIVTAGELAGKSALVIKMPDEFSGFFPALDSNGNL